MANSLATTPVILDTVANNLFTADTHWAKIRWVGATTAAHAATLTDSAGTVIWSSVASGANYVEIDTYVYPRPLRAAGALNLTALGSGKLYLYPF